MTAAQNEQPRNYGELTGVMVFNATFNNISVISWRHGELKIYIETVLKIYDEVLKQSWCLVNNYDELVVIFYSQFKTSVLINCHTNTNSTECTV